MLSARLVLALVLLVSSACSSEDGTAAADGAVAVIDAPATFDAAVPTVDAPVPAIDAMPLPVAVACPTAGRGGIVVANASCVLVTPAMTGAAASGEAADVPSYAIAPMSGASGELMLFLNGSGGSPHGGAAHPAENVYTAALAAGHHVIGLSYRSAQAVGAMCAGDDGCYLPTRLTLMTGVFQTGASNDLADIQPSEGVHERLALLLGYLVATDPTGGWDGFLVPGGAGDPGDAIVWSKVIVSGHSQGGGHAALLGKLHPVARVVSLSSPCDRVGNQVASWLHADASWKTDPSLLAYGFGAATLFDDNGDPIGGDTVCAAHDAAWTAMGLAETRQFDDAIVCDDANGAHGATISCTENFPRLEALFAP